MIIFGRLTVPFHATSVFLIASLCFLVPPVITSWNPAQKGEHQTDFLHVSDTEMERLASRTKDLLQNLDGQDLANMGIFSVLSLLDIALTPL